MHEDDLKHLLALSFIEDMGPVAINSLLSRFDSPRDIFSRSSAELTQRFGLKARQAESVAAFHAWDRVDRELERAAALGITIAGVGDERYPRLLRHIYDYPPLLYLRGAATDDDVAVAVVGSRRATAQGRHAADRLCRDLAVRGITVVSGLARGIDSSAHRGALAARGRTIAVLGSGLDVVYPPENGELHEAIGRTGLLVSEYPLGTQPLPHHFPRRNRIISGISYGVVVIEASEKSGSLITARCALEQGRDVFAVPGSIDTGSSRGTNRLIQNGAKLVQDVDDIINEIRPQIPAGACPLPRGGEPRDSSSPKPAQADAVDPVEPFAPAERAVLDLIGKRPVHIDSLVPRFNGTINSLLALLLTLEMRGCIRQLPGRFYTVKE